MKFAPGSSRISGGWGPGRAREGSVRKMGKTPKRTTRERAAEKGESEDPAAARAEPPASPALQATPAPDGKRSKKKQRAKDDAEAQGGVSAEGGKRRKMAGGGGERKIGRASCRERV